MNHEETAQCLNYVMAAFPSYKPSRDALADTIAVWHKMFKTTDFSRVEAAIDEYVKDGAEFPPALGQIRKLVNTKGKRDEGDGPSGGYWKVTFYTIPANEVRIKQRAVDENGVLKTVLVPVYQPDDTTPIEYAKREWIEGSMA